MPSPQRFLLESDADPDPFAQFDAWFEDAARAMDLPEAMALATAGSDGRPSVRMVLLKDHGPSGFVFHTDGGSRKGRELSVNPWAALLFHWDTLGRQVRIEGPVERLSAAESDAYFATRPRGAQVAAQASEQSAPVPDRAALDTAVRRAAAQWEGRAVPRPADWGGYRVQATAFEFWQNGQDRLHDRLAYRRHGGGWVRQRLQP